MQDLDRRARTAELVDRLANADPAERDVLVEELAVNNMPIARAIARRYAGRSQFGPDLEQVAYLALVRAAQDYDVTRGHDFLAYAVPCMTGAVKRFFRDSAWVVRPPRRVQEWHQRNRESGEHVADGVHLRTCLRPRSLDVPNPGSAVPVGVTLVDESDRTWEQTEVRLMLAPHLRAMPPQARRVLHRRFVEDRTQQEIADELGVSQYQVSRLLTRYLGELRERLTATTGENAPPR
jgi:RNA polymerase sigma-B factor